MNNPVFILIAAGAIMFIVIGGLSLVAHYYTLNGIKSRTVGTTAKISFSTMPPRAYSRR